MCNIRSEPQRAELIKNCDVIIFDETPVTRKYCIEALDNTLRDLMRTSTTFGGKAIVFSGDFRQTGPIVTFGSAADSDQLPIRSRHQLSLAIYGKTSFAYGSLSLSVTRTTLLMLLSCGQSEKIAKPNARFPDGADLTPLTNCCDNTTTDHFTLHHTTDFGTSTNIVYPHPNLHTRLLHDRAILATTNASLDASNDHIIPKRVGTSAASFL